MLGLISFRVKVERTCMIIACSDQGARSESVLDYAWALVLSSACPECPV